MVIYKTVQYWKKYLRNKPITGVFTIIKFWYWTYNKIIGRCRALLTPLYRLRFRVRTVYVVEDDWNQINEFINSCNGVCVRAYMCLSVSYRPKWRNLSAIMLVAVPLRLETMACIYALKKTPTPKQTKKTTTHMLQNIMTANMRRTKAPSKAEGSASWTVKWPLVLQQTN